MLICQHFGQVQEQQYWDIDFPDKVDFIHIVYYPKAYELNQEPARVPDKERND